MHFSTFSVVDLEQVNINWLARKTIGVVANIIALIFNGKKGHTYLKKPAAKSCGVDRVPTAFIYYQALNC